MKILSAFLLSLGLSVCVWAEEATAYFCIEAASAGMSFNQNTMKWDSTRFQTGRKFILRKPKQTTIGGETNWFEDKNAKWVFANFDDTLDVIACMDDFNDVGYLRCESVFVALTFSKETMRYQTISQYGYVLSKGKRKDKSVPFSLGEGSQSPSIHIGTCSPL